MDLEILKKKLSTYRTQSGKITKVSDDLLVDILAAWEQWTGPAKGFYSALGADRRKMARLLGRAKQLKREGHLPSESFKEIRVEGGSETTLAAAGPCSGVEIIWESGKLIRFQQVEQLVDFLKKVA